LWNCSDDDNHNDDDDDNVIDESCGNGGFDDEHCLLDSFVIGTQQYTSKTKKRHTLTVTAMMI